MEVDSSDTSLMYADIPTSAIPIPGPGALVKRNRWKWNDSDVQDERQSPKITIEGLDDTQCELAVIRARMNYLNLIIKTPLLYDRPEVPITLLHVRIVFIYFSIVHYAFMRVVSV